MADWATRDGPSPLWNLHQAFAQYVLQANAKGVEVPDDLVVVIGVEMYAYMRRCYHVDLFSIRGCPIVFENRCAAGKIHFLSSENYDAARKHPEYWR